MENRKKRVFVLNTPILTGYGTYSFKKCSVETAKEATAEGFESAIGHEATAKLLSQLLGREIPVNRAKISMAKGDVAIVFRVLQRLPEGTVLEEKELKKIPYELGILRRIE